MDKYSCPCCGHPALDEQPPGTVAICDTCGWEDDTVQFNDPDYEGGANSESLVQARQEFVDAGEHPDLVRFVSAVAQSLPQTHDDDDFVFTAKTFPWLPVALSTSDLIIKKGYHDYGTWRIDYPQVFGRKPAYEALGIISTAVLLNPERDALSIRLSNPESEVKTLRVEFEYREVGKGFAYGLLRRPEAFVYLPDKVESKPWLHEDIPDPHDYPHFSLTNRNDCPITDEDWAGRDVLVGFGTAEGTARLAQLFLDMSRAGNEVPEFLLESEAGFRGVAPASAEIRFWLPGGYAVEDEFPAPIAKTGDA